MLLDMALVPQVSPFLWEGHVLVRVRGHLQAIAGEERPQTQTHWPTSSDLLFLFLFQRDHSLLAAPVALSPLPPESQLPVGGCVSSPAALPRPDPASRAAAPALGTWDFMPPFTWSWSWGCLCSTSSERSSGSTYCRGLGMVRASHVFEAPYLGALGICPPRWAFVVVEKMLYSSVHGAWQATLICSRMSLHILPHVPKVPNSLRPPIMFHFCVCSFPHDALTVN